VGLGQHLDFRALVYSAAPRAATWISGLLSIPLRRAPQVR
jgi:hypothetical protein